MASGPSSYLPCFGVGPRGSHPNPCSCENQQSRALDCDSGISNEERLLFVAAKSAGANTVGRVLTLCQALWEMFGIR